VRLFEISIRRRNGLCESWMQRDHAEADSRRSHASRAALSASSPVRPGRRLAADARVLREVVAERTAHPPPPCPPPSSLNPGLSALARDDNFTFLGSRITRRRSGQTRARAARDPAATSPSRVLAVARPVIPAAPMCRLHFVAAIFWWSRNRTRRATFSPYALTWMRIGCAGFRADSRSSAFRLFLGLFTPLAYSAIRGRLHPRF